MQIKLANPRGFCAGVDRAIEIVNRALEVFGPPIYVRHEVVHNKFVVEDLRSRGAIFVEELEQGAGRGAGAIMLFCGLLHHLQQLGAVDHAFITAHTTGFDTALAAVSDWTLTATAAACGISESDLATFFGWFTATERSLTFFSQGINQSASGVDKGNAIINCHLATGRIGKPGAGPFSITGQPNAMGGREVGGLANQLAARPAFVKGAAVGADVASNAANDRKAQEILFKR